MEILSWQFSGFGDQIAQRVSGTDTYKIPSMEDAVKIHPNSGNNLLLIVIVIIKSFND